MKSFNLYAKIAKISDYENYTLYIIKS